MSKMLKALGGCFVCGTLVPVPAIAAPNVFWTFGFNRHYSHGTGGRAQVLPRVMLAARTPADPGAAVHKPAIAPIASARIASAPGSLDDRPIFHERDIVRD